MLKSAVLTLALAAFSSAQQQPSGQPQVKMNYINSCSPSAEDQAEIKSIFARVQTKPAFSRDFEVTRGRTNVKDAPESKYVRLRRDMAPESALLAVQYAISTDVTATVETLVLRSREAKDFHELALEDEVSPGAAPPATLLDLNTPVSHIRVERIGKSSIVLSRCPQADQSAFEPLFRQATEIMAQYRKALSLDSTIQMDVAWMATAQAQAKAKATTTSSSPVKNKASGLSPAAAPK